MKKEQPKKETKKPVVIKVRKELIEGLQQRFKASDEKYYQLHSVLTDQDFWQTTGRVVRTILTHSAVQKLADMAGVGKDPEYTVLTQPDAYNNYQYTMQCKICRGTDCVTEIGEANRSNVGSKGRGNPANMAQKRAYDRAVLRLLGITGLLSEEELSDEEVIKDEMEGLTHEERKVIAPFINNLLLAKTKENIAFFNSKMKEEAKKLTANQLDYMRKLYKKKVAELSKVSF